MAIDKAFYTALTDNLLSQFYPKFCCKKKLTQVDGKRYTVLRCPQCHKQQTRLVGTPLHHLKVPRWIFSYLLKESQLQYPKVITTTEIMKRVNVSTSTAVKLKRRLQLFASDILPRMQQKFYQDNKLQYHDFRFPKDRSTDLTDLVKDKQIPQADTVVLYSCGTLANKGRKRFKHKGQTSSIYMSESLGGKQVGTLVNTIGVKGGPVFYDSIPNSKAETVNPILFKYIPVHNPVFTDMGYSLPSMNHRTVNHSRKSPDKRFRWSRNRWSKNGVHCQVAEGRNGVLKRSFAAYGWINPKNSTLYLNEYSVMANLRHFAVEDLLPAESLSNPDSGYRLDDNWNLRGLRKDYIYDEKLSVPARLEHLQFAARSLPEIFKIENTSRIEAVEDKIKKVQDPELANTLAKEFADYQDWASSKPTVDQRKQQRYYESLAEKLWYAIPERSYIEIHDLAHKFRISGKHVFRLFGAWTRLGLLDSINLNAINNGRRIEYFDVRRNCQPLIPIRYVYPKGDIPSFNKEWRAKLRRIA